jgi:AAA+ ATPase superfamily predicted ATPase
VFHTGGGRPVGDELAMLSGAVASHAVGTRDLTARPFSSWDDALDALASMAEQGPLLVVLDEFPELVRVSPELPSVLRAFWDRAGARSSLRVLLCSSAVRTMAAIQEARAPQYGRLGLSLQVHPFHPHEAALMLPSLRAADMALVWGILGGVPLYLEWWDQGRSVRENLLDLGCRPGGLLLNEGRLVLATDAEEGDLPRLVLHAIAAGRTRYNEIADAVRAEQPARTLDKLVELRMVERLVPVTEDPRRSRRRSYRVADNFLAFWLSVLDRYRSEIERGLGASIVSTVVQGLDDHMGPRWEEAFREHLRRMASEGVLDGDVVTVGPYWDGAGEIDAVVLTGRAREVALVGDAKWARELDGRRELAGLRAKAGTVPATREDLLFALCARERVTFGGDALVVTAEDIFSR